MLNKEQYLTKTNVLGIRVGYRSLMGKEVPHVTTKARGYLTAQPPKEQTPRGIKATGEDKCPKNPWGFISGAIVSSRDFRAPLALLMKIKNN